MIRKKYKVKGEDVDDFMIMHGEAYQSYITLILESFLFEKGYSKRKLNDLKVGLQKCKAEFVYQKQLMFTQSFFLNIELSNVVEDIPKINIKSRFFNAKNELCAMATVQLYWFDYASKKVISPPQNVFGQFLQ